MEARVGQALAEADGIEEAVPLGGGQLAAAGVVRRAPGGGAAGALQLLKEGHELVVEQGDVGAAALDPEGDVAVGKVEVGHRVEAGLAEAAALAAGNLERVGEEFPLLRVGHFGDFAADESDVLLLAVADIVSHVLPDFASLVGDAISTGAWASLMWG